MMLPTEKEVDIALQYLASTDEKEAKARGRAKSMDERKKLILALEFDKASGSGVERTQKSLASDAYSNYCLEYENAIVDHALLQNKRKRAELTISVWQSINANRRKGNI